MSRLLDKVAAAERLNVSPRTLERWRLTGDGPEYVRLGGRKRGAARYSEEAIERYLRERSRRSTSEPMREAHA